MRGELKNACLSSLCLSFAGRMTPWSLTPKLISSICLNTNFHEFGRVFSGSVLWKRLLPREGTDVHGLSPPGCNMDKIFVVNFFLSLMQLDVSLSYVTTANLSQSFAIFILSILQILMAWSCRSFCVVKLLLLIDKNIEKKRFHACVASLGVLCFDD